jgi:flagellar hook protein FlgE
MFASLNTALSGLQQFQQQINVVGNNIANVNTTGYKDERMDFEDAFNQALGTDPSTQVGNGVGMAAVQTNFAQGTIASTGVASDLAVSGNGFFVVKDPTSGNSYVTRAGDFQVDSNGYLITANGQRVQGFNSTTLTTTGDLKIDATGAPATAAAGATVSSYNIDSSGNINVTLSDGTTFVRGQVTLQNFSNPGALVNDGDNLYTATTAAGGLSAAVAPNSSGTGKIESSALESSNVDLTGEMTNLISAQRAFEANAQIVSASNQVLQDINNLTR